MRLSDKAVTKCGNKTYELRPSFGYNLNRLPCVKNHKQFAATEFFE